MRGHYLNYLYVIKTYWLGDEWVNRLHDRYKDMRFRRRGREHEKPQDFIQARLLLLRALLTVPPGSAEEVREVMRTAPITWKTLLNLNAIPDTPTLIRMIGDRQQELIVAAAQRTAGVYQGVSKEYLDAALARMQGEIRGTSGGAPRPRHFVRREANAQIAEAGEDNLVNLEGEAEEPEIGAEAFVNEIRRQRPPPPGGYPYPRVNGNRTRLQKPPPSPCKHCGSNLHWDRECRHHMTAMVSEKSGEDVYVKAYHAALEYTASEYVATDKLKYAFISDAQPGEARFVDNEPHIVPAWNAIIEEDEPRFGPINILEEGVNYAIEEMGIDFSSLPNHHHSVLRGERSSAIVDSSTEHTPANGIRDHETDQAFVDKGRSFAWDDSAAEHSGNEPMVTPHGWCQGTPLPTPLRSFPIPSRL
ncbi:hypothetical protein C8R47DRAFT_1221047 [Mycena vitilis]|nr:hypothetical protein C8R47DRAFT_1221047 [Mycena vitilis]